MADWPAQAPFRPRPVGWAGRSQGGFLGVDEGRGGGCDGGHGEAGDAGRVVLRLQRWGVANGRYSDRFLFVAPAVRARGRGLSGAAPGEDAEERRGYDAAVSEAGGSCARPVWLGNGKRMGCG